MAIGWAIFFGVGFIVFLLYLATLDEQHRNRHGK
jgi:hypothetical protein